MSMRYWAAAVAGVALFAGAGAAVGVFDPARAEPSTTPATDPNRLYATDTVVPGERISVEVVGRGPDVILVPGLSSSRTTWKRTVERLKDHYRLHIVQVAGFAGAPAGANAAGPVVEPTAEAIDAYIVKARLAPATYIGHSLGGTMGLYLAQRHPEHFRKVMLVDSLPFLGILMGGPAATPESLKPMMDKMSAQMSSGTPEQGKAMLQQMSVSMAKSPEGAAEILTAGGRSDRAVVGRAYVEDNLLDLRPGLAAMTTPVTLVYPFDAAFGMPQAQWDGLYGSQFAPLKTAKLVRVDDSRHFVMFDQPAKFDAAVDAFLAN